MYLCALKAEAFLYHNTLKMTFKRNIAWSVARSATKYRLPPPRISQPTGGCVTMVMARLKLSLCFSLLPILFLFLSELSKAQTGPGGVGTSASNILWLKADAITGLNDNDPVATWADNSGNTFDLIQGTAASKPTYQTNEINSKPIVRFDGSDDNLIRNPFAGFATTQITAIIVNKNNGESSEGVLSRIKLH